VRGKIGEADMIQLALWLVSFVIVAGFVLLILGGIVSLFSAMFAPRPASPPPPTRKDSDTPPWVSAICYIVFFAGLLGGAMFADEANRINPRAPMTGWMYVALGVVLGAIAAGCVYALLMQQVAEARKEKARRQKEHEDNVQREHRRVREEARAAALAAYPEYLDDDTLRDPTGLYAWPDDLFDKLFVVPDVVIPYKTKYGHDGEVRLWSKVFVAQQSRDPDYVEYKVQLDRERTEAEEIERREEEERREAERVAREEEGARRAEEEAVAARKARQIVIPLDELKRR